MSLSLLFVPRSFQRCLSCLIALVLIAGALLTGGPARADAAEAPAPFRFVFLADTHVGSAGWNTAAAPLAAAIRQVTPAPSFLVHGGDISETGATAQYDRYLSWVSGLGIPGHHLPGNHDVRWLDAGKATFQRLFGAPYRSFDHQGVHFVLLDVTIDAETHGHADGPVLTWLRADLERVRAGTPVLIFLHHPPTYPPATFMDNAEELFALLQPHRVLGVFAGHGHLQMRWQFNDIPVFMVRAANEGGFVVVDVDPAAGRLRVQGGGPDAGLPPAEETRNAPPARRLRITSLEPLGDGRQHLVVETDLPKGATPHWRTGSGPWQPLTAVAGGLWLADVPTAALSPGRHRLQVYATTGTKLPGQAAADDAFAARDLGPGWHDFRDFTVAPAAASPVQLLWQVQAGAGIQGAPASDGGMVYVASREGAVFGLYAQSGIPAWRYLAAGAVTGGVALDGRGRVFVGDAAGNVHAVGAASGQPLWRVRVGGPVLGQPLVAAGRVLAADMSGRVTAIDPATGQVLWRYEAGAPLRAAPGYGAGRVFVGAWDSSVHAVDVGTGARRWRAELPGNMYYSPANARPFYYRGRLYVTRTPPQSGDGLFALDAFSGQVLWSRQGSFGYSAPILHGGTVVVTKTGGDFLAFDPQSGEVRTQAAAGVAVYDGSVSSFGGDLVVGGHGGEVVAIGPDARVRWRYRAGETYIYARPAADRERVYIAGMDGTLAALSVRTAAPEQGGSAAPPLVAGSPGQPPAIPPSGFKDTDGHWADPYIARARAMGLAGGQPDGTFSPDQPVTRAQLAAMVARWLGLNAPPQGFESRLPDIRGHWAEASIMAIEARGLAGGVPGPGGQVLYDPDAVVNRGQAAALLARMIGRLGASTTFRSQLTDLEGHWARDPVTALEEIALVSGVPVENGRLAFQPDLPMTRAQAVALLVRTALGE